MRSAPAPTATLGRWWERARARNKTRLRARSCWRATVATVLRGAESSPRPAGLTGSGPRRPVESPRAFALVSAYHAPPRLGLGGLRHHRLRGVWAARWLFLPGDCALFSAGLLFRRENCRRSAAADRGVCLRGGGRQVATCSDAKSALALPAARLAPVQTGVRHQGPRVFDTQRTKDDRPRRFVPSSARSSRSSRRQRDELPPVRHLQPDWRGPLGAGVSVLGYISATRCRASTRTCCRSSRAHRVVDRTGVPRMAQIRRRT